MMHDQRIRALLRLEMKALSQSLHFQRNSTERTRRNTLQLHVTGSRLSVLHRLGTVREVRLSRTQRNIWSADRDY